MTMCEKRLNKIKTELQELQIKAKKRTLPLLRDSLYSS